MGPDKSSSPRKDSAYTPNSQPRIPTRVCQGHVVTTDLPTLGTNPKQSRTESTNQEGEDLAVLHSVGRTVRVVSADHSQGSSGLSEKDSRTSSTPPQITDRLRWARGPSAPSPTLRHLSTVRPQTSCNKNPPTKWIERKACKKVAKDMTNCWLKVRTVRQGHADRSCGP
jgi:hypothetical protein